MRAAARRARCRETLMFSTLFESSFVFYALLFAIMRRGAYRAVDLFPRRTEAERRRLGHSLDEVLRHSVLLFLEYLALAGQPWLWRPEQYWEQAGMQGAQHDMGAIAYAAQLAHYAINFVYTFIEPQTEFSMMVTHHVATLSLVSISYAYGFWRYGLVIMALCEPSDVLLHLSKLFRYGPDWKLPATLGFVAFFATWMYTRVYWITWKITIPLVGWRHAECAWCAPTPLRIVTAFLILLSALFVVWTWKILLVLRTLLVTARVEDVRDAHIDSSAEKASKKASAKVSAEISADASAEAARLKKRE